jgi:hypothetical protein
MPNTRTYYVKIAHNDTETVKVYQARNMTHAHTLALKEFQPQDENAKVVYCLAARNGM